MTNTQLSKALFGLCRRHIAVNYQETKLIEEAARRLQDLGEKERPDPIGAPNEETAGKRKPMQTNAKSDALDVR